MLSIFTIVDITINLGVLEQVVRSSPHIDVGEEIYQLVGKVPLPVMTADFSDAIRAAFEAEWNLSFHCKLIENFVT